MNLIFAEMINCTYGVSIDISAALQHGWKLGRTVCNTTGFLLTLSGKYNLIGSLSFRKNRLLLVNRSSVHKHMFVSFFRHGFNLHLIGIGHSPVIMNNTKNNQIITIILDNILLDDLISNICFFIKVVDNVQQCCNCKSMYTIASQLISKKTIRACSNHTYLDDGLNVCCVTSFWVVLLCSGGQWY